jgi:methylated-DNA-[protein]-cysteine S-methyltransferase
VDGEERAAPCFALFDTAVGRCGIAWSADGVLALQLPEGNENATRARLLQLHPRARESAPAPWVQQALEDIVALLAGKRADLSGVPLDMAGIPVFHRQVYEAARAIGPGATLSYGEVAARLGVPGAARAVGQALGRNPFTIIVPCHRVLAAGGRMGGFSANGGIATKLRLLSIESVHTQPALGLFEGDGALGFDAAAAVDHLRSVDPVLARLIDSIGPCQLEVRRTASMFSTLARAIVYQQLTGKAAQTIFARLCALFPHPHVGPTAEQVLRTSDARLQSAGLSRQKLLYLRDLARRTVQGKVPTLAEASAMTDDAIIERLTEISGIGRWTVDMLLIFRLGRPDVLPVGDLGVRKGFGVAYRKRHPPTPAALALHGERWRPYRTVASWYLWRAADRPVAARGSTSSRVRLGRSEVPSQA